MKYKSKINPSFLDGSVSYTCIQNVNINPVLYECIIVGYEFAKQNYNLQREGLHNYLINYTLSGSGEMIYKGKKYTLEKGDLFFINCNEKHEFYAKEKNWEFVFLHFNGLGVPYLYNYFNGLTGYVFKNYPSKVLVKNITNIINKVSLLNHCKSGHTNMIDSINSDMCLELSSIIYEIIIDINRNLSHLDLDVPYSISKGIAFIESNYNKKINLQDVSNSVGLSLFHFERMFNKYMRTTIYQYIKYLRFQKAKWLLETTDKKLIDIALEIGYSDIQALNKLFKSQIGLTPTQYRKEKNHIYFN